MRRFGTRNSDLKATVRLIQLITVSFLILLLISIALGYFLFIRRFSHLEILRQQEQLGRVRKIINAEYSHLEGICGDWAIWDESWAFLRDENPGYIDSNLSLETLLTLNLNLMSFVRNDGSVKWQMETDIFGEIEVSSPDFPQDVFPREYLDKASVESSAGILPIGNRVFQLVIQKVVEEHSATDSPGILVLGRELTPPVITNLGNITNIDFRMLNRDSIFTELGKAQSDILFNTGSLIRRENMRMVSYSVFSGIDPQHSDVFVKIDQDMVLMRLGIQTYILYLLLIIGSVLSVVLAVLLFMRKNYLHPVKILLQGVLHIKEQGDLAFRISDYPDNEFGQLCHSFNSLLDVIQDQTIELNNYNLHLHEQANTDELTGLYNKRFFRTWQEKRENCTEGEPVPYSFLLLDIDHFKLFNDRYGHIAGDVCIRNIGKSLQSIVTRDTDFCCRYGGEEFLIILENTDSKGAVKVAQVILNRISQLKIPHADSSTGSYVSISIGVASSSATSKCTESEALLDLADKALYESKKNGRNCYTVKEL